MRRDEPVVTERLHDAIEVGKVQRRSAIEKVEGSVVQFMDGTRAEVDVIICATGYVLHFPFLDERIFRVTPDGLGLYKVVFHPDRPTLAFIGMSRATGAIMPLAEMQARWASAVLRGTVELPGTLQMKSSIGARRRLVARRNGNPFRIEYEPYMDALAAQIGALPQLWKRPLLLHDLLFGKPIAARYRLDGPGHSPIAERVIRLGNVARGEALRSDLLDQREGCAEAHSVDIDHT
jgi:dimethylaniline monooxygenase (N-oxide forming)